MFYSPGQYASCKNLWIAVLKQAIEDLNDNKGYHRWAKQWIDDDNKDLPGFLAICELLELNPDILREKLKKPISFRDMETWKKCYICKRKCQRQWMRFDYIDNNWICRRCEKKLDGKI